MVQYHLDCSGLTTNNHEFRIWGMRTDPEHLRIAFDSGDNGFLQLTVSEARALLAELRSGERQEICGFKLTSARAQELAETLQPLLQDD